jgi:hypothetical protein
LIRSHKLLRLLLFSCTFKLAAGYKGRQIDIGISRLAALRKTIFVYK